MFRSHVMPPYTLTQRLKMITVWAWGSIDHSAVACLLSLTTVEQKDFLKCCGSNCGTPTSNPRIILLYLDGRCNCKGQKVSPDPGPPS